MVTTSRVAMMTVDVDSAAVSVSVPSCRERQQSNCVLWPGLSFVCKQTLWKFVSRVVIITELAYNKFSGCDVRSDTD